MISQPVPSTLPPGPAWEVARLFPDQGDWGDSDYLVLNQMTNRFVELTDGNIEVLETPTRTHQLIGKYLVRILDDYVESKGAGKVVPALYPVRVRRGKFREPDVVVMLSGHLERLKDEYAESADLVFEIVSQDRDRDFIEKRADYAEAGIPEYWIVDPRDKRVTVLRLHGVEYRVHGEFGIGERATSVVLEEFAVQVSEVFAAGGI